MKAQCCAGSCARTQVCSCRKSDPIKRDDQILFTVSSIAGLPQESDDVNTSLSGLISFQMYNAFCAER